MGIIIVAAVFGIVWFFRRSGRKRNERNLTYDDTEGGESTIAKKKEVPRIELSAMQTPMELEGSRVNRPEMG